MRTLFQQDVQARTSFPVPGGIIDRCEQNWLVADVDYHLLDLVGVQAVLAATPAATCTHPESLMTRTLFDCPAVPLSPAGPLVRVIVATHPATAEPPAVGEQRAETVYELFVSTRPSPAFRAKDVLDLYLHRDSFETVLFAPAHAVSPAPLSESATLSESVAPVAYGPPQWAKRSFTGGFPGSAFTLQPDGTLRCPADHPLYAQERRPEHDGSLRVLYAGRMGFCRVCPLRERCQEHPSTKKPRRVSAVFWPLPPDPLSAPAGPSLPPVPTLSPSAPLLWRDWPRRSVRRHGTQLLRRETVTFSWEACPQPAPPLEQSETLLTREQRAHYRLSWSQRLVRNARSADAPRLSVLLHGLPARFF